MSMNNRLTDSERRQLMDEELLANKARRDFVQRNDADIKETTDIVGTAIVVIVAGAFLLVIAMFVIGIFFGVINWLF